MSDLTRFEKMKFEKLFGMGSGYVLDFSNRTFQEFFIEAIGIEIYDVRFEKNGSSKANHLRAFWELESNALVATAMKEMLLQWQESNSLRDYHPLEHELALFDECQKAVARLQSAAPIEDLDAVRTDPSDKNFSTLTESIRDCIRRNEPEAGLDRLHTYTTKFLRTHCEKYSPNLDKFKPLHSLMGEYIKHIKSKGLIKSEMTERILRSSISILESFNEVRNNQSLAHDNQILGYDESLLIFNHVISAIKFIDAIEIKNEQAPQKSAETINWDEDIPF